MLRSIAMFFLGLTGTMPMTTPTDLALYTKCQPDRISHWIGQRIIYERTDKWESAETCMTRGVGDCKCMAVVAEETLNSCAGVEARVVTLKNDAGNLHAVTLYTNHKGKKGFIDEINRKQYEPETAWRNIVADIGGGPWTIVEWQAFNQAGGSSPPSLSGLSAIATAVPAEPVAENPAAKANVHASATAGDLPPSLLVDIASQ